MEAKRARVVGRRLLALVGLSLVVATSTSGAHALPEPGAIYADARITGDGPWTSWLGGSAERNVLVTIENRGTQALQAPELELWSAADGAQAPLSTPSLDDLAPGDRVVVEVGLDLPRFSFGTHAVEGVLLGAAQPLSFRAETTHVPWLLLLLPSIVLAQVVLVSVRNRIRRHIHRPLPSVIPADPASISLPTAPCPDDAPMDSEAGPVAAFIEAELDRALTDLDRWRLDDHRFLPEVEQWARIVTERVTDHFDLVPADQPALGARVTRALLERAASPRQVPSSSV